MAGKIESYLGFCIKARKIALGSGTVELIKKGVYLIMVCSSASQNTVEFAVKMKNRFSCPLVVCKCGLENVVHKAGCKIAAIKDAHLAKAILENVDDKDYELYTERL